MKSVTQILDELGVNYRGIPQRNFKTTCPHCSHTRKNKKDPCLSVRIDTSGVGVRCFNCNFTAGKYYYGDKSQTPRMAGSARHLRGGGDKYGDLLRQARSYWR